MSTQDDEFNQRLRATFRIEAAEHLQTIGTGLLELEKAASAKAQRPLVEAVFRAAHSLKGAARAVNFTEIESICQSLEDVFASWKRQERAPSLESLDTLHRALNNIEAALAATEAAHGTGASAPREPVHLEPARAAAVPAENVLPLVQSAVEKPLQEETVRIAVAKLDARLLEAEEMIAAKLITHQQVDELRELAARFESWRKDWLAVEPDVHALRQTVDRPAPGHLARQRMPGLARLLEFMEGNADHFRALENKLATLVRTAEQDRHAIGKLVDDLLEDSKKLLLLPFATLSASCPKLVRDLCRDQGKEAELVIQGEDVEIDKCILEEMKDPLIHLLRNCIDHGVETPEARRRLGKPAKATITLALSRVNGKVELRVADDGAGIDIDKVKAAAVKHGLLTSEEARDLGDADAQALVFHAEVSTSPIITRLSGRGLGLAIVRERAEKLSGEVSVNSEPRVGTCVRIMLPAMLATFRGVLVEAAGRTFVVPTAQVERVARVTSADIKTVENRETIPLNGHAVALVNLAGLLGLAQPAPDRESAPAMPAIILGVGEQRIAFAVDAVLAEQEVLVKPLRKPLSRVRNIAGATVLGSGQVVPILNVTDLLKSATTAGAPTRAVARPKLETAEAKAILVAEDSITSRMLLKNILESAGYRVKTAVDGMDAFMQLRSERFDLIVSDVEMPRMDGFDLTARIRADKKLAEVPVVLVTALESREDRERGIDAGASAYLVKSSFDQSNLLEAVRRLI